MPEWKLEILPSFQADVEKYQIDKKVLKKWLGDLQKKPDYMKNAHPLQGALKPLWSAHINLEVNYIVAYLLCFGNLETCFQVRGIGRFAFIDLAVIKHACDKKRKKIYVCRLGTHRLYNEL